VRGEGNGIKEQRMVKGVTGVDLATLGDMTIVLGEQESLIIEAEENLLQYIEASLSGGILTIQTPPGVNLMPTQPVRYTLTVKNLERLEVTSSGSIAAPAITAENFAVRIRSSGNITLEGLTCERLEIEISSSGNLVIAQGQVGEQTIRIQSSGSYEGGEVLSQVADIQIDSSGSATVWVSERLEADLTSSGNVNVFGSPEVSEQTSSSGKVIERGEK
jgi:hypothetical protein